MTGLESLWLPIVLSAVIVFVASSIIHMAPLWHKNDYPKMPNEDKVTDALRPLAIPPGDYLRHLDQMVAVHGEAPAFVQNRCFARLGWDREVRRFCKDRQIIYQGFSLLTANPEVLRHPLVAGLAARANATAAQIVFCFARKAGMLPITGTSDPEHMKQDLDSFGLDLSSEEVRAIESLAG